MCREKSTYRLKRLDRQTVCKGAVLDFCRDTVELPDGRQEKWDFVHHRGGGGACVVPVLPDGRILMIRQYRPAIGRETLELPAGGREDGESPARTAARELREETGYTAEEWIPLGDFHPAPAYSDEYISMYMARRLHAGRQALDADEFLDVIRIPLTELVEDVMAGRISDAKTQTAVLKAARLLGV